MNMRLGWLIIGGAFALGCGDDSPGTTDDTTSTGSTGDDSTSITITGDEMPTSADSTTGTVDTTMGPQPESTSEGSDATTQGATDSSGGSTDGGSTDGGTTDGGTTSTDSGGTEGSSGTEESSSGEETGEPVLPDITGEHLLAVAIVIEPQTPLQYLATIVQTPDGDGASLDIELQALTLDLGSTTDPRLPFGAPIVIDDVAVAADGTFSISIPMLDVPGPTNPITGGDVEAVDVVLDGDLLDDDSWCGTMEGEITSPLMFDLAGSTFAGTRVPMGVLPNVFPGSC